METKKERTWAPPNSAAPNTLDLLNPQKHEPWQALNLGMFPLILTVRNWDYSSPPY